MRFFMVLLFLASFPVHGAVYYWPKQVNCVFANDDLTRYNSDFHFVFTHLRDRTYEFQFISMSKDKQGTTILDAYAHEPIIFKNGYIFTFTVLEKNKPYTHRIFYDGNMTDNIMGTLSTNDSSRNLLCSYLVI